MQCLLPPLSLYIHLPWCVQKCPYCDFNSHKAADETPYRRYITALLADLALEGVKAGDRPVESIFLGGGTPSLFSPDDIRTVLDSCRSCLSLPDDCEITMEANPGTVEHGSLAAYREAGVTRLSIGAQSFSPRSLKSLGRIHGPKQIEDTFAEAQSAGFDSINLDLMFALPGQDRDMAAADIAMLLEFSPAHISYYQLTLEPNTVFFSRPPAAMPDEDTAWDIQEHGQQLLRDAGYEQYEISAFARPGHRCHHNLNYWQFGDYLAIGAGAHGKLTSLDGETVRYQKPANPLQYMEHAVDGRLESLPVPISGADLDFEFMLNVLRLSDGFSRQLLEDRIGEGRLRVRTTIDQAVADGLLECPSVETWRPTSRGFQFLNDLQARFLP